MLPSDEFLLNALEKRRQNNSQRSLVCENTLVDFCSTDYLGFARSEELKEKVYGEFKNFCSRESATNFTGSTGSRLMRGNYFFTENLEKKIAAYHHSESCLIFNSGYDANVGLLSSVLQRGDIVLHDELIHVSSRDGIRMSFAKKYSFRHNDLRDLQIKLEKFRGERTYVAVESVYSMDGDFSPLKEIAELCNQFNARLIVDEAHATGVFGPGGKGRIVELGLHKKVFAVIHTFGKGLGCHGAAVLGSNLLRDYLLNFSHSFIYSTALPPVNLIALKCAYDFLKKSNDKLLQIKFLLTLFKDKIKTIKNLEIIPSDSPIQGVIIPGNDRVKTVAKKIQESGYDVRAVLSPSVPREKERIRICLHAFNSDVELEGLVRAIQQSL